MQTALAAPTAVVWDIGNVIVRWDPRTLYQKIFDDVAEMDAFLEGVCTMAWNTEFDRGLPMTHGVDALTLQHPRYGPQIAAWRDRWAEMLSGVIPETVAAIEALAQRGVPQFGLSNMSPETQDRILALHPVFGHLDPIIFSGEVGLIKPDAAIFELAIERFGRPASELLFIDDSAANIEAARALGFHAHLFEDPAAIEPLLRSHGLL
jgi:2-haloacid dehalogenase/putative hydrolase of the HAD superfamily